jgi:hypothetical protein
MHSKPEQHQLDLMKPRVTSLESRCPKLVRFCSSGVCTRLCRLGAQQEQQVIQSHTGHDVLVPLCHCARSDCCGLELHNGLLCCLYELPQFVSADAVHAAEAGKSKEVSTGAQG